MRNQRWRSGLIVGGALLALCVVFGVGFFAGRWSGRVGSGTTSAPAFPIVKRVVLGSGHGAVGVIQSVEGQTLALQRRDGAIQIVLIDDKTGIERNRQKIARRDLKVGDRIAVIGSPNAQGQIIAKWVHVFTFATSPMQQ